MARRKSRSPRKWPANETVLRKVDDLAPHAKNARTHTKSQLAKIAASIEEWGWTSPVLIDDKGTILAGHGRVMAAASLGIEEVPCVVARGWTAAQKRAYVIADNEIAAQSGWDEELLRSELSALEDLNFDLAPIGLETLALSLEPLALTKLAKPATKPATGRGRAAAATDPRLEFGAATALERTSGPARFWETAGKFIEEPRLDFGCGKDDRSEFRFDPFHAPDYGLLRRRWSTVTCNYVLNVQPSDHLILQLVALVHGLLADDGLALFAVWNDEPYGLRESGKGWQNTKPVAEWRALLGTFFEVATVNTKGAFFAFSCRSLPPV